MIQQVNTSYPKYEEDFYGWAMANAKLLKERKLTEVDYDNLIEEIESMGRSEKHQLVSRLSVLLAHLLKWQYQPEFKGRSWSGTIGEQRIRIREIIDENPSLKPKIAESIKTAYKAALAIVKKETSINLKSVPQNCPYTFEQCIDESFYPPS